MFRRTLPALAVAALAACASVPAPKSELAKADLAIRTAQQSDAAHYAPLDMRKAQDAYQAAQKAAEKGDNLQARRLAEDASAGAELADMKARAARAKEAEDEARASIKSLDQATGETGKAQ